MVSLKINEGFPPRPMFLKATHMLLIIVRSRKMQEAVGGEQLHASLEKFASFLVPALGTGRIAAILRHIAALMEIQCSLVPNAEWDLSKKRNQWQAVSQSGAMLCPHAAICVERKQRPKPFDR